MAAIDRSIYERFDITSADGTNSVDLRGGIVTFSYFENLFSPMITAQAIVVNTGITVGQSNFGNRCKVEVISRSDLLRARGFKVDE